MTRPNPPKIGPTGSAVVSLTLEANADSQLLSLPPPIYPSRWVLIYDDDEVVDERELTDVEYAEEIADYKKATAAWKREGRVRVATGPTVVSVSVECKDGCEADGVWSGKEWRWMNWKTKATR